MYPIIMNGDHAEFESEWAGRDPKERPDWPLPSFDARDWAQAFCKLHPDVDEGAMISWFANALMRGFDEATSRYSPTPSSFVADIASAAARVKRKRLHPP
jgi:hypothetical protein